MVLITNLLGRPRVFTLKDGSTLRLLAYESKEVSSKNITDELIVNEKKRLISIKDTPKKKQESPKKKKVKED